MSPGRRGYGRSPWTFRGDAHYQFHLVKSEVARQYVPADMPLVEAFGHTLGGFYYANYSDSPVGRMDELVVLSGLVWNAPTSCAWASHVFVDHAEAVAHGKRVFGLPSHRAVFRKTREAGAGAKGRAGKKDGKDVERVVLREKGSGRSILELVRAVKPRHRSRGKPQEAPSEELGEPKARGPKINFQLPSFSGRTKHHPKLLKYDLDMSATIQPCKTFNVVAQSDNDNSSSSGGNGGTKSSSALGDHVGAILSGKRVVSLNFRNMLMRVRKPEVVH